MYDPEDYEDFEHTDEFTQALNELITKEINTRMENTVKELEFQKEQSAKLSKETYELEREIIQFEPNLKKALKEKELEVKRDLFNGFAPGDTAFTTKWKHENKTCEKCKGDRKLIAQLGEEEVTIDCPSCRGRGVESHSWYEPQQIKIKTISLEISEESKQLKYYYGYDWDETKAVFKTEQECQVYCDEKKPKK